MPKLRLDGPEEILQALQGSDRVVSQAVLRALVKHPEKMQDPKILGWLEAEAGRQELWDGDFHWELLLALSRHRVAFFAEHLWQTKHARVLELCASYVAQQPGAAQQLPSLIERARKETWDLRATLVAQMASLYPFADSATQVWTNFIAPIPAQPTPMDAACLQVWLDGLADRLVIGTSQKARALAVETPGALDWIWSNWAELDKDTKLWLVQKKAEQADVVGQIFSEYPCDAATTVWQHLQQPWNFSSVVWDPKTFSCDEYLALRLLHGPELEVEDRVWPCGLSAQRAFLARYPESAPWPDLTEHPDPFLRKASLASLASRPDLASSVLSKLENVPPQSESGQVFYHLLRTHLRPSL